MDQREVLLKRIAYLETVEDHLETEMDYLNTLLKEVGFEQGIFTLKMAAEAIVASKTPT